MFELTLIVALIFLLTYGWWLRMTLATIREERHHLSNQTLDADYKMKQLRNQQEAHALRMSHLLDEQATQLNQQRQRLDRFLETLPAEAVDMSAE